MTFPPLSCSDCPSSRQGWGTGHDSGQSGQRVRRLLLRLFDLSCVRWLAASLVPRGGVRGRVVGGASQVRECAREDKHASRNTNPANVENKHTQTAVWPRISVFIFHPGCFTSQFAFLGAIRGQRAAFFTPPHSFHSHWSAVKKSWGKEDSSSKRLSFKCHQGSLGGLWVLQTTLAGFPLTEVPDRLSGFVPQLSSHTNVGVGKGSVCANTYGIVTARM